MPCTEEKASGYHTTEDHTAHPLGTDENLASDFVEMGVWLTHQVYSLPYLQEAFFFDDYFKSLNQFEARFICPSCSSSRCSEINS